MRHDQASNKSFCLIYRTVTQVVDNFLGIISMKLNGIGKRLLFLQLNTAPLVSSIVEKKTTPRDPAREKNVTSKNDTNQNTTRTTHNDSVR